VNDLAERRGIDTEVYEPAEDSRLLAETALSHLDAPDRLLDVGTGSGYVGARLRDGTGASVAAIDLNPHACWRASEQGLDVIRGDLLTPVRSGLFDAVTFNPPYLPAGAASEREDWLTVALSGGKSGRAVIERFLDDLGRVLAPDGDAYLLVSTVAGVDETVAYAGEEGFHAAALADVSFPGETLTVLKLFR